MIARRAGAALPGVLFCLVIAEITAAAILLVSAGEVSMSRAAADALRARIGAESAVRAAVAGWDQALMRAVAPGTIVPIAAGNGVLPPDVRHTATAERLGRSLWIVRGQAASSAAGRTFARANAAAIIVTLPDDELWLDFAAAITSGQDIALASGATIDGLNAAALPPAWRPTDCPPPSLGPLLSLLGSIARPAVALAGGATVTTGGATLAGTPTVLSNAPRADSGSYQRLGPLTIAEVAASADRVEIGAVSPTPASIGPVCDATAPTNWGAPLNPAHPCADYFPLIFAPGALHIRAGSGQGILVVGGDLTLDPGASFYGAILVLGRIDAAAATIHGAIRTGAGAVTPTNATIHYNACTLWRAFTRSPALRRAHRPPGRWWLPSF